MTSPQHDSTPYTIRIPRVRFTMFLVLVVTVLLINHVMLQVFHYQLDAGHWLLRDLFDVDEEENFPTYFASFALLISAGLLYVIASAKSRDGERFARHWLVLSIVFLLMSIDEVAGMHESLNTVTDFPWTIPAAALVLVGAVLYFPFLIHLPPSTRYGCLGAGILFAGGAVGVEHATDYYLVNNSMDTLVYNLLTALEEALEMFGVVLFIHALLGYMAEGPAATIGIEIGEES